METNEKFFFTRLNSAKFYPEGHIIVNGLSLETIRTSSLKGEVTDFTSSWRELMAFIFIFCHPFAALPAGRGVVLER